MTGLSNPSDIIKGFKLGGSDYLLKPIELEELFTRVENHLKAINLQASLKKRNHELHQALQEIRTLEGLLPICSSCKKIRDKTDQWLDLEEYIETRTEATFSHGMCPECCDKYYGHEPWYKKAKKKKS